MKTITLIIALIFSLTFSYSQENKGIDIEVTMDNLKNNTGKVVLSLHTVDTFMKGAGTQNLESKIEDGKIKITFKNVTPGDYAIMALHDANENNRMDFELNGMPKEDYGMSNNPMSFGPPQFGDAKFTVADDNLEMIIRL